MDQQHKHCKENRSLTAVVEISGECLELLEQHCYVADSLLDLNRSGPK